DLEAPASPLLSSRLLPQTVDPFGVDLPALTPQQGGDRTVAVGGMLLSGGLQGRHQLRVILAPQTIPRRRACHAHQLTGTTLRVPPRRHQLLRRPPPGVRAYHFFRSSSLSASLSMSCSASMRLSRAFSASSARTRCTSALLMSP